MVKIGDRDIRVLIGAVVAIITVVPAIVLYIQVITGRISLAEYLTEVAKSQIPMWVPILVACPIVGVIIILVIYMWEKQG